RLALAELARQIDLAQEPPLPVEDAVDEVAPADETARFDKFVTQLALLSNFGVPVTVLAERARALPVVVPQPWKAPPGAREQAWSDATAGATALAQQVMMERELGEEGDDCHCEEP